MKGTSWLTTEILNFMTIINKCLVETSYADDRLYYEKDLAYTAKWLIMIHQDMGEDKVIDDILDSSTSKFFYDVFKKGVYGDLEAEGFKTLQSSVSPPVVGTPATRNI